MSRSERKQDVVDEALANLRDESGPELPDPRIERRMVALASLERERRSAGVWRPRSIGRVAAGIALFLVLGTGAVAATVGFEGLRKWWFSIRVGDETVHGTLTRDGRQSFEFTAPDGFAVRVQVERDSLSSVERTRVAVEEVGPRETSEEVFQVLEGETGDLLLADLTKDQRYGVDLLAGSRALHRWTDSVGVRHELHLIDDPQGSGCWLAVRGLDEADGEAVRLVQALARPIGPRGFVEVVEHSDGSLAIEIDDGQGWVCELELTLPRPVLEEPELGAEWTTPSGRVHVELGQED